MTRVSKRSSGKLAVIVEAFATLLRCVVFEDVDALDAQSWLAAVTLIFHDCVDEICRGGGEIRSCVNRCGYSASFPPPSPQIGRVESLRDHGALGVPREAFPV